MPTTCIFKLNKSNTTYAGGEVISGNIILQTTSEKQVNDIKITFFGEATVSWEEFDLLTAISTIDDFCCISTVTYESNEVYINETTILYRNGVLPIGTHTYAFKVVLPLECPGTFKSDCGHIAYELCLKISRNFRSDYVFKKPVNVFRTVDLNSNPNYKLPVARKACCKLGFWPLPKDKIFFSLKIPYSAYIPGQKVIYTLYINNQTADDTRGYIMEFIKTTSYVGKHIRRKKRQVRDTLITKYFPSRCLHHSSRIIKGEFTISQGCAASDYSSIIRMEYHLKARLKLKGCSSNPYLILPITIGSIPIRESLSENQGLPRTELEQVSSDNSQLAVQNGSEEPPSYSEAIGLN